MHKWDSHLSNSSILKFWIQNVNWSMKSVIILNWNGQILDFEESWIQWVFIKVQLKAVKSFNHILKSKWPKHCVHTFWSMMLSTKQYSPFCFSNQSNLLLNNSILLMSCDPINGDNLIICIDWIQETQIYIMAIVSMVSSKQMSSSGCMILKCFLCQQCFRKMRLCIKCL